MVRSTELLLKTGKISPDTCLKNPISPEKIGDGPVKPSLASSAAMTLFLQAFAAVAPFHMLSSPALVCLMLMLLFIARFKQCSNFLSSRSRRVDKPAAEEIDI